MLGAQAPLRVALLGGTQELGSWEEMCSLQKYLSSFYFDEFLCSFSICVISLLMSFCSMSCSSRDLFNAKLPVPLL